MKCQTLGCSGEYNQQGTCPSCEAYILAGNTREKTNHKVKKPINKIITNYDKS